MKSTNQYMHRSAPSPPPPRPAGASVRCAGQGRSLRLPGLPRRQSQCHGERARTVLSQWEFEPGSRQRESRSRSRRVFPNCRFWVVQVLRAPRGARVFWCTAVGIRFSAAVLHSSTITPRRRFQRWDLSEVHFRTLSAPFGLGGQTEEGGRERERERERQRETKNKTSRRRLTFGLLLASPTALLLSLSAPRCVFAAPRRPAVCFPPSAL